jgi:hypothetical protein
MSARRPLALVLTTDAASLAFRGDPGRACAADAGK